MSLESDLFEKLRADEEKLLICGFVKEGNEYTKSYSLCDGTMTAVIAIDASLKPYGKVYDEFEEEYVAFRPEGTRGTFAAKVRGEYIDLLESIVRDCFVPVPFSSDQANRVYDYIKKKYNGVPEHIFAKYPEYAVWRHTGGKWYALAMETAANQIEGIREKTVILNLKVNEKDLEELLKQDGIYPAFHMNRKHWITVTLNDTVDDEKLFELIQTSNHLTSGRKTNTIHSEWIVPANPKYFDLDHAFEISDLLYWKQSSKVKVGDLVYIYYGAPYSELRYLCVAVQTDIPYKGAYDGPINMETLMRLKKLCFFDQNKLNRKKLAEFGVTNIRGPRYMPEELKKEISRLYDLEEMINE